MTLIELFLNTINEFLVFLCMLFFLKQFIYKRAAKKELSYTDIPLE